MPNYLQDKVVIITGAAGGFGRLIALRCAAGGAHVVGVDVDADGLAQLVADIRAAGGSAIGETADVVDFDQVSGAVAAAVDAFGTVDVLVNNAGVMPLAFFSDHREALTRWHKAIDINIKGVVNGIAAVFDQMVRQGRGEVVNISSIYGNAGTEGSGVYSATKAAVTMISDSLRAEAKGKIKVTTVKPTGVLGTNLDSWIVNDEATVGLVGQRAASYGDRLDALENDALPDELADIDSIKYWLITPDDLAAAVVHVINQPWGISLSDVTVRASGEDYLY